MAICVSGLLVEALVSLLQEQQRLLSTFAGWSSGDLVADASEKLLQQRLNLSFS